MRTQYRILQIKIYHLLSMIMLSGLIATTVTAQQLILTSGSYLKNTGAYININGRIVNVGSITNTGTSGLNISGEFLNTGTFTPGSATHEIDGDITNNGSIAASGSTIKCDGTAAQTIAGTTVTTLNNLISDNAAGVIIGANLTLSGTLAVNADKLLTINPPYTLIINGNTTINGSLILEGNDSLIANIIDNGSISYGVAALVNVKKTIVADQWHYNSTPVVGADANVFRDGALYRYNEPTSTWLKLGSGYTLLSMVGYDAYFITNNKNAVFYGNLHTGPYSIALTRTVGSDGFNFVGNPYPSPVDWDAATGWTKTNINDAIYMWDPTLNSGLGNYISYVAGVGTNGGTRYIPSTQAFFVIVSTGQTSGTLGVTNEVRVANTTKFRSGNSGHVLDLVISTDDYEDETIIRFDPNASLKFDGQYDAIKMYASNTYGTYIFTKFDSTLYSINTIPESEDSFAIPLHVMTTSDKRCTISSKLISNFSSNWNIILEDLKFKTMTDCRLSNYEFDALISDDEARFLIHFIPDNTSVSIDNDPYVETIDDDKPEIKVYFSNQSLYILNNIDKNLAYQSVSIFTSDGKLLTSQTIKPGLNILNQISNKGMILLRFFSTNDILTQRFLIY